MAPMLHRFRDDCCTLTVSCESRKRIPHKVSTSWNVLTACANSTHNGTSHPSANSASICTRFPSCVHTCPHIRVRKCPWTLVCLGYASGKENDFAELHKWHARIPHAVARAI